jgi:hypothetical protein
LVRGFALAADHPPDDRIVRFVTEGAGTLPGRPVSLLRWDANSVHGYVFDTGNALVIRGASRELKRLDEELREGRQHLEIGPSQVLYTGGGGGLAVVPADQAETLAEKLHGLYARRTLVATCTVGSVPIGSTEDKFGHVMAAVNRRLAHQRTLTGPDAEAAVPFFASRCRICGRRAATVLAPRGESGEKRQECAPCHRRLEAGKKLVQTTGEISDYEELASGHGMLAVIYLDGNGVGDTITRLDSPLAYARFSEALERCMTKAFDDVAERYHLKKKQPEGPESLRCQIPIEGGDDRVIILAGDVAVPLARDFLKAYEEKTGADDDLRDLGVRGLGAAAGVALGKAKLPVRHLFEEAEELMESAKKRVYQNKVRSALDFLVVDDGTPRRASVKAARFTAGDLLLSGKPYALDEMADFSTRREAVTAALATSQLHALRRIAEAGRWQLRNHVLYQIGRSSDWRTLAEKLAAAGTDPVRDPNAAFDALVPEVAGRRIFDVADMIELEGHWNEGGSPS